MEENPELRRSKRVSCNRKRYFCELSDSDSYDSDGESMTGLPAEDDLSGRGCITYIDDIKIVEFETLEDMKYYDTVAEKLGGACCASFSELYLPFRGFSDEEVSQSKTRSKRFKAFSKKGIFDENQNSKKVSEPSNKDANSKLKCPTQVTLNELGTCGPHREESCVTTNQKSDNLKMDDDGCLLTTTTTPNAPGSYNSVAESSMELIDSDFGTNFEEDLLLTSQDSPSSELDPLCSHSLETSPIDLKAIPYIFKCRSASPECANPRACGDSSTHFTLCAQINLAKGRGLSKFATKYLASRQECNLVDRVSATIAASAVQSSKTTVFVPLSKDIVCRAFPESNVFHYLESPSSMEVSTYNGSPNQTEKLLGCSNLEKTPYGDNDVKKLNTSTDNCSSIPLNSNQQENSDDSKNKKSGSTPSPQKKKSRIDLHPDGQQILERPNKNSAVVQNTHSLGDSESTPEIHSQESLKPIAPSSLGHEEIDKESPPSIEKEKSHPRGEYNPSSLEFGDFAQSGSVVLTDSFSKNLSNQTDPRKSDPVSSPCIQHTAGKLNSLDDSVATTGEDMEEKSDSGGCLSDILYPTVECTSSLASFFPSAGQAMLFPKKLDSTASLVHSEMRKPAISEGLRPHSNDVIDLTTYENDTQLYEAAAAKNHAKAKKREGLYTSSDQIPEKVIIIDDDPPETDNQLEIESARTISSSSTLKKLEPNINRSFLKPVYKRSDVPNPTMCSRNVNLMSNPKVIDLTECSDYDTQNDNHSGLPELPGGNSEQKVIDLTEGDEDQPPINVDKTAISEQLNVVSDKDDVFNMPSLSKSNQGYSTENPIADYSVKSCSGLQELAVMCLTIPSLGFIKVVRCQSGELMLNETFTARVYKQFNDLKALNLYLNLRFEKIAGVKDRRPLEWILATPGVIKLKKVRPINPKVWFHPNDYILAKDGSDSVCLANPSNLSKAKSSPNKTKSSLVNSPVVPKSKLMEAEDETNSIRSSCTKPCPEKCQLIPVATCSSASSNKVQVPRTAKLVSVLLNKQDRQELGLNASEEKQISSDRDNCQKLDWPQNSKPCGSSKPTVTNSDQALSMNINHTAQNKHLSSNGVQYIAVQKPVPKLSYATQYSGFVPVSMTSKSFTSQSIRTAIASGANQPTNPNTRIQNTYLSDSKPAVMTNKQHSQTNQTSPTVRLLKIMDQKPSSSQIINTLVLNNDPTSLPIKTIPSHSAAVKSSKGRTFVIITNNKNGQSINPVPLTQTGTITDQIRAAFSSSNSPNLKLLVSSLKAQGCKVNQGQVSSRSNSVHPVSLPNNLVGQSTNQESSNLRRNPPEKPPTTQPITLVVDRRLNQNVNNHRYIVTQGIQQSSNSNYLSSTVRKPTNFTRNFTVGNNIISSLKSSSVIEPSHVKYSGANATTKPAELVKSRLSKVVYPEVERNRDNVRPAPLKLHWPTINNPKPS